MFSVDVREAPGKTYVEKRLFFIRQMETDTTSRDGNFCWSREIKRERRRREEQKDKKKQREIEAAVLFLSVSFSSFLFLTSAAERQLTKSVEQLMQ